MQRYKIAKYTIRLILFSMHYCLGTCTDDQGKENQLSTNDLAEVLSELMDANNQWYNLGLMLGVQYGTLKGIKSTENDIQDCLREMLAHWLESSSSHTWRDICNALRSNTVKQGNLADTIEEKKCKSTVYNVIPFF